MSSDPLELELDSCELPDVGTFLNAELSFHPPITNNFWKYSLFCWGRAGSHAV